MGTWDIGSFDNDTAADFSGQLDDVEFVERVGVVREALLGALAAEELLDSDEAEEAMAAAALVAAQRPGGEPVDPAYGPKAAVPDFPAELDATAVRALDRVCGAHSELARLWAESGEGERWRERVARLRAVLAGE